MNPTRRNFLTVVGAAGTLATLSSLRSVAQTPAGNPRRIDVHHHFVPDVYLAFEKAHDRAQGNNQPWVLSKDMEDMDKAGTATALLSITTPGFLFGETMEVRRVIRGCNEAAAKLAAEHRGRFGSFAAIPLQDTEGALKELEYALDTLKADGIGLFSNYGDKWLGYDVFNPVYEELNRRKAVVYVHPQAPACCANMVKNVGDTWIEYGADTARTIASLINSGSRTKYPDITWIFSHAGGVMPFVVERFLGNTAEEIVPGIVTKGQGGTGVVGSGRTQNVPKATLYEIRRMYYDTAQASNPVAMTALKSVAGTSQIVFGTDYWFRTAEETGRGLMTNKVFTDAELRAINRGNVERLLPKYKS